MLEWIRQQRLLNDSQNNNNYENLDEFQSHGSSLVKLLSQISNTGGYSSSTQDMSHMTVGHSSSAAEGIGTIVTTSLTIDSIPPPKFYPPSTATTGIINNNNKSKKINFKNLCFLCHQPRKSSTVSTGGYLYCYECITNRENTQCPNSLLENRESDLINLYDE